MMCDMAYGNNAVRTTIDSLLSRNVEFENKNEKENSIENEDVNENENKIENRNDTINKNDKENKSVNEIEQNKDTDDDSENNENDNENEKNNNLTFQKKRLLAYNNWMNIPHTPYKKVREENEECQMK